VNLGNVIIVRRHRETAQFVLSAVMHSPQLDCGTSFHDVYLDYSYLRLFVPSLDFSYPGLFVPG